MAQVYLIHLVLARLSRRQAFGANPQAVAATSNRLSPVRAEPFCRVLVIALLLVAVNGCVGTRGVRPGGGSLGTTQVTAHGSSRQGVYRPSAYRPGLYRQGAFGTGAPPLACEDGCLHDVPLRPDYSPAIHNTGYHESRVPQHSLPCRLGILGKRVDVGCADPACSEMAGEPEPRESWTLPGLRGKHKAEPPEVSRFLPVPSRPAFESRMPAGMEMWSE